MEDRMSGPEGVDLMRLLRQERNLNPQTATREALAGIVGPVGVALDRSITAQEAELAAAKRRLNPDPPQVPTVTPRSLPRTRDRFVAGLVDKNPDMRKYRTAFLTADLFWVTSAMADLTTAAAATIPEQTLERALAPADTGFMVFERSSGSGEVPARGLVWHFTGEGLLVFVLIDAVHGADRLAHQSTTVRIGDVADRQRARNAALVLLLDTYGPLLGAGQFLVPYEVVPGRDVADDERVNVAWLRAAWALMRQPFLCETRTVTGDASTGQPGGKVRPATPDVTLVDLRHARTVEAGEPGHSGRTYQVQWIVSGHWRNQACGPGRASRRLIFVDPYTKGPDGAPLRAAPKVNVWRR